jgi:HEAT repeat protein
MRALAVIQPPERTQAFIAGLKDASDEIRIMASAGWMKAATIPNEAVPSLIEALRDPELQVRANAANALGRLAVLPDAAIPLVIECTADLDDGLRLNAALALKRARSDEIDEVMHHLISDPNSSVRLIAASYLLSIPGESYDVKAGAVLMAALGDPIPRVRKEAHQLFESLGPRGSTILEELQKSEGSDEFQTNEESGEDPESLEVLDSLAEH